MTTGRGGMVVRGFGLTVGRAEGCGERGYQLAKVLTAGIIRCPVVRRCSGGPRGPEAPEAPEARRPRGRQEAPEGASIQRQPRTDRRLRWQLSKL